jgi:hypothetical protein
LLIGAIETVNYVLVQQKLDRTSATLSDLVSQTTRMTEGQMTSLFAAVDEVMRPYDLRTEGRAVVSSISARNGNPARIDWQRATGGGTHVSRYGAPGATAALPDGLAVRDGENVIACEAWFEYHPILFTGLIPEGTLYRSSVFRPRFGRLDTIAP